MGRLTKSSSKIILLIAFSLGLGSVLVPRFTNRRESSVIAQPPLTSVEQPVTAIPLLGPIADRESELSGLAWYQDNLILLPQYPERLGNVLFVLSKSEVLAFLSGDSSDALAPKEIALMSPDFAEQIEGFEGFEAIAFTNNQAFLTIEAETSSGAMGYIVTGILSADLSQITIDPSTIAISPPQSDSLNKADEALLLTNEQLVSIYEVSGEQLNPTPQMNAFDFDLSPMGAVPFPTIEYRITDATALDADNRFWAINYFYPGDRDLLPDRDAIALRHGRGTTHRQQAHVERLVEFAYDAAGITQTDTTPIQLLLEDDGRNWEGIARLDNQGFLLVTDKFPETILGFVEKPDE